MAEQPPCAHVLNSHFVKSDKTDIFIYSFASQQINYLRNIFISCWFYRFGYGSRQLGQNYYGAVTVIQQCQDSHVGSVLLWGARPGVQSIHSCLRGLNKF